VISNRSSFGSVFNAALLVSISGLLEAADYSIIGLVMSVIVKYQFWSPEN
jgi:hypothetical protein